MFQILVREKKRRAISPLFLAVSAAAHVLVFGGVMYAASATPDSPKDLVGSVLDLPPIVEKAPETPKVERADPVVPPETPDEPAPVVGETVVLQPPAEVPVQIAPPSANETPITAAMVTGIGKEGDVFGTPDPADDRPPTGNTNPGEAAPGTEYVPDAGMVDELPLLDRNGLARLLERHYPPMLRDARVSGRVVVELIVDRDGRVRPESAKVIEASHAAFGEATVRAAERFRFRPAKIGGMMVPVKVSIPIVWTLSN
jgi:protein TonB